MADKRALQELTSQMRHGVDGLEQLQGLYLKLVEKVENATKTCQDESPYVLALIDGHTHPFANELLQTDMQPDHNNKSAADLLRAAIIRYLTTLSSITNPANCRLEVRVYADLTTLDCGIMREPVCSEGSCSTNTRPLAAFAADFSRSDPLFDFIDAGSEQAVEQKVTRMFEVAVKDPACKHILFGAWRRPFYISFLRTHCSAADKVTLILGQSMGPGLHKVLLAEHGLPYWSVPFPGVFSPTSQTNLIPIHCTGLGAGTMTLRIKNQTGSQSLDISRFSPRMPAASPTARQSFAPIEDTVVSPPPITLPKEPMPGFVPVNKDGDRLDVYMSTPTARQFSAHLQYVRDNGKPCNHYHLMPPCLNNECPFAHVDMDRNASDVLRWVVKTQSRCIYGSRCRRSDCLFGHVCQRGSCRESKEKAEKCCMRGLHAIDLVFDRWALEDRGHAMFAGP